MANPQRKTFQRLETVDLISMEGKFFLDAKQETSTCPDLLPLDCLDSEPYRQPFL